MTFDEEAPIRDYTERPVRTSWGEHMIAPRDEEICKEHGFTNSFNTNRLARDYRRECVKAERERILAEVERHAAGAWGWADFIARLRASDV